MQWLAARSSSFSKIPHGAGNGWYPADSSASEIAWIRGSWEIGGHGYCADQAPSVGSVPWAPCTW